LTSKQYFKGWVTFEWRQKSVYSCWKICFFSKISFNFATEQLFTAFKQDWELLNRTAHLLFQKSLYFFNKFLLQSLWAVVAEPPYYLLCVCIHFMHFFLSFSQKQVRTQIHPHKVHNSKFWFCMFISLKTNLPETEYTGVYIITHAHKHHATHTTQHTPRNTHHAALPAAKKVWWCDPNQSISKKYAERCVAYSE